MSSTENNGELAFLHDDRPLRRRTARWRMATLQFWLSMAERLVMVVCGIALAPALVLPPSAAWLLEPGLLAAVAAGLALPRPTRRAGTARIRPASVVRRVLVATVAGGAVLLLRGCPAEMAGNWALAMLLASGLAVTLLRILFARMASLMLTDGRLANHVAVVGDGPVAFRTLRRLGTADPHLAHVIGRYLPTGGLETGADGIADEGAELARGSLRTLLTDCRLGMVDTIVLALEPGNEPALRELQVALRPCIQEVYFAAELIAQAPESARVLALGTTPLMLVGEPPVRGLPAVAKLLLDQLGAWLLLAFLFPLLLATAVAIRLETPGPVLFRQLRVGYNNQLFYIFKFRSMHNSAADRMARQQTVAHDRRVTRVGRIIRYLSLDELPQLLNVIRGEMSLVGPRPHAPGTSVSGQRIHTLVDDYNCRHLVRPGITGLAQARGQRGGLETPDQVAERLASDLEYIRTWSPWGDVRILAATLMLGLRGGRGC